MPISIPLRSLIMRYSGVFDLQELQKIMVQWLKARRYWFQESTVKTLHGNEYGKEREFFWKAERKVDSYVRNEIVIYFHIWDLNDIEVMENGKKKKIQKGRVEIWFRGQVVFDYQGHWEKTKFHKSLRDFYHKYIMAPEGFIALVYWDELYYRVYKLRDLVKEYLDMKTKGYEYRRYLGDNV